MGNKTQMEQRDLLYCRNCEKEVPYEIDYIPIGPHSGKIKCSVCGQFLGWKKKDKNLDKRSPNKVKPSDYDINFCQLCLRKKEHLGFLETFDIHHVWPIEDEGQDIKENTWLLCTHCHKLVHHTRTYLNDHFKFFWEKYDNDQDA